MSVEVLREAARLMRERASTCERVTWETDEGWYLPEELIAPVIANGDQSHISGMTPGVALAVADWLDKSAETWAAVEDDLRGLEGAPTIEQVYGYDFTEALAVARAYLGDSS